MSAALTCNSECSINKYFHSSQTWICQERLLGWIQHYKNICDCTTNGRHGCFLLAVNWQTYWNLCKYCLVLEQCTHGFYLWCFSRTLNLGSAGYSVKCSSRPPSMIQEINQIFKIYDIYTSYIANVGCMLKYTYIIRF